MIIRKKYLNKLIAAKDTEFIKVITGVRRSGKSTLLLMFKQYLFFVKFLLTIHFFMIYLIQY